MTALAAYARRHPGIVLLAAALAASCVLYLPSIHYGLVGYDDTLLVQDNWLVHHPSWSMLHAIFFDLDSPRRYVLSPEYLPVRDLSVTADFAVWGTWYAGHHLTNLAIYLAAITCWYLALVELGIDPAIAGLALLVWAIHPSHAESVAWLAERKGLLGMMFAGAAVAGHARYRAGRSSRWLGLAVACTVAAIWSKAIAAFAIAGGVGLELVLPARRASWRRSLTSIASIAIIGAAASIPVVMLAARAGVIGAASAIPGGRIAGVVGVHGFYVELAGMVVPNAIAYPIASRGPSAIQLAVGAVALAAVIATVVMPRCGWWAPPPELKAAGVLWLAGWLPVGHLIGLQQVAVADRYALVPTLGFALAIAVGIAKLASPRAKVALTCAIVLAASVRAIDARSSWEDPRALWSRATESDPSDPEAGRLFAEALGTPSPELAEAAVARGLARQPTPRLWMRRAILDFEHGDRAAAIEHMTRAATAGDPVAMANLARLLLDAGRTADALGWARRAADAAPYSGFAFRALGAAALADQRPDEAESALARALVLEPTPEVIGMLAEVAHLRRHAPSGP